MSVFIFRNHDKVAIKHLLKEIGRYRYEMALENMKISQPPISMDGFYLEANPSCIFLCYKYPSRVKTKIMKVDGFTGVPKSGWTFHPQKNHL